MFELAKHSGKRLNARGGNERLFPKLRNLFVRGSSRVAAMLSVRNILVRAVLSPQMIRLRIRAAGKPLLGLPALPQGTIARASKIVVLRLDRIGDAILFTSFLRELRMGASKAEIHLVCSPVGFPVYKNCPHVNRVHVFDHGQPVYLPLSLHSAREHWRLYQAASAFAREHLAPLKADAILSPRFEVDSYGGLYLAAFSRARFSISYSEKSSDIRRLLNRGQDKLWSAVIPSAGVEHEVLRNAAFLDQIGISTDRPILEFWPTAEERHNADAFLARLEFTAPVVLAPGASEPRKQWPAERFVLVARALENAGKDVVLIGSESDAAVCSAIASKLRSPRVKDASGQLNLGSLFCLLQRCSGFVGNDSGPAHLAAAAGIPVVVVSCHPQCGKDDYHQHPRRFGPWSVPHRALQPQRAIPPCVDHCSALQPHCIEQISAEQVTEAILDLLIDGKGARDSSGNEEQSKVCVGAPGESR